MINVGIAKKRKDFVVWFRIVMMVFMTIHLKNIEGQSISAHLKQCITPSLRNMYASIPLHFD